MRASPGFKFTLIETVVISEGLDHCFLPLGLRSVCPPPTSGLLSSSTNFKFSNLKLKVALNSAVFSLFSMWNIYPSECSRM